MQNPIKVPEIKGLEYFKKIGFEEVFKGWEAREASDAEWIKCATQVKGWPDWKSWRRFIMNQLDGENLEWDLFSVTDPSVIAKMQIGPFQGWQNRIELEKRNKLSFEDLLLLEGQMKDLESNTKIAEIRKAIPFPTQFIGLRTDEGKIICIDGHHRAVAFALEYAKGNSIHLNNCSITIALAELKGNGLELMKKMLERGTERLKT